VSEHASTPDSEPGGGLWRSRKPWTPRVRRRPAWFAQDAFSASWWRGLPGRLADSFRSRRPGPGRLGGLPDLLDANDERDTFTLETPALGDAYNFLVHIRCSWCVQGTARRENKKRRTQEIRKLIAKQRPIVLERIEDTIRPVARKYPPYRAAQAEAAILDNLGECLSEGDVQVKIRARVDVCEPVREDLRKIWQARLAEDSQGDLRKASVELIGELQESWRELLLKGLEGIGEVQVAKTGWIAPYALALAQEPQESAGAYLQGMIEDRVSHAERLLSELSNMVLDKRVDAIEFAFETDSALRSVLTYLGVPVPQRGSGNGNGAPSGESAGGTDE
jgi:hypothetical protein